MYPHRIFIPKKGIQVLQPFDPSGSGKARRRFPWIDIMVWDPCDSIQPDKGKVELHLGWRYSAQSSTRGQSKLYKANWATWTFTRPKHVAAKFEIGQWQGKMPEYEVDHPDDSDSDASARSLDSEFGVPIMRTPVVKKGLTSANEELRRSSRANNPVTRYAYNEYMAHHYGFMMKVTAKQELETPSLPHMLEGQESKYCATAEGRRTTAQRSKKAELWEYVCESQ